MSERGSSNMAAATAAPLRLTPAQALGVVLLFLGSYYLLGLAGLALQSAQTGVTPMWPASGAAFALSFWFGARYALLILPAMLALAFAADVPLPAALLAAVGSMLEVILPAYLLRRLRLVPDLAQVRDTLLFVGIAVVLGPVFSASLGTLAMVQVAGAEITALNIWLLWWLGNSLGLLVVGGVGLLLPSWRRSLSGVGAGVELALLLLLVGLIVLASGLYANQISSSLLLYLLVPIVLILAIRRGQLGVLAAALIGVVVLLLVSHRIPDELRTQAQLGTLYLDITLLWVITFTGMVVSAAFHERAARERVAWLAAHDPLTRLVNRHAFLGRLGQAVKSARQHGHQHGLLYLDLDQFKAVNDTEGHAAGDRLLAEVGALFLAEVRGRDTVARLGGDEFAVLLENCPLVEARGIAENLRRAVEDYAFAGERGEYRLGVSLGVVPINAETADAAQVLHLADTACYEAKRSGRNRVWVQSADPTGIEDAAD